jgi:ATP-dependent helicase HepA
MIEQAEQLAATHEQAIVAAANRQMQDLQQSELERLQTLARVNPNIRQQEIDHILAQTSDCQDYLASAHIRLEALRVAVVTDQHPQKGISRA